MITDRLSNIGTYRGLHPNLDLAIDFLEGYDAAHPEAGRVVLDGDRLFYTVSAGALRPIEEGDYESHQKYLDIQLVLAGEEMFRIADSASLPGKVPYDPEKDAAFFAGNGHFAQLTLRTGEFGLFFPQDAHLCMGETPDAREVLKMVMKVSLW